MPDPNPDRKPDRRQIKAKEGVTFHAEGGDVKATIIGFAPYAHLALEDGTEVTNVREGKGVGEWTSIPPRR